MAQLNWLPIVQHDPATRSGCMVWSSRSINNFLTDADFECRNLVLNRIPYIRRSKEILRIFEYPGYFVSQKPRSEWNTIGFRGLIPRPSNRMITSPLSLENLSAKSCRPPAPPLESEWYNQNACTRNFV